jgi:hypothetical protein
MHRVLVATLAECWLRPWSRPKPENGRLSLFWENKMMQRNVCYSAIAATIPAWLLSVAILISAAQFNVAQAQDNPRKTRTAVACGEELKKQCSGVPVQANNMLECLKSARVSSECSPHKRGPGNR